MTLVLFATSRPAAADTDPCSDPVMHSASVQSTLQVKISGVDWPSITSITKVTIPEAWRGAMGLFGNGQQQGDSLRCFMPIDQGDFQAAPPSIVVDPSTRSAPTSVDITNSITMIDGPEAGQSWSEGLWSVVKHTWGYQVIFDPEQIPADTDHGQWTVTLDAPGLNVQDPSQLPSTDDGHGDLTWSFSPSPQQLTRITGSLTSPWQVRMNLATDRWPIRWFSDATFALSDGLIVDFVALWISLRLLRCRRGNPEQQRLPKSLIFISLFSIACYAGYVVDDYFWHENENGLDVRLGYVTLVTVAVYYFMKALGIRKKNIRYACVLSAVAAVVIIASLAGFSNTWSTQVPSGLATAKFLLLMIPLLSAMTFMYAGTVLWISRLWPFGTNGRQGCLRDVKDTPFHGPRVAWLLICSLIFGACLSGQSAGASYYIWQHTDTWGQGFNPFPVVLINLINDGHWWIADGIQWPLFYALAVGIFALLWDMSADARGVFFGPYMTDDRDKQDDRRDLVLMAAIVSSLFVGTWGFYDGVWVPIPFIAMFVGLTCFGLTRRLSKLDWELGKNDQKGSDHPARDRSFLVAHRNEFLSGARDLGLPKTASPGSTALALGPGDTWWDNGVKTLKIGWYLAIAPIAFDTYAYWTTGSLSQLNYPFGLQDALGNIATDAIGWFVGVFMFGVLLPYMKGARTPIKGCMFGLIAFVAFGLDAAVTHVLSLAPSAFFPIDGILAIALFSAVGALLDFSTLRSQEADLALTRSLYPFGGLRVAVTVLTTLVVVGVTIWQTIYITDQTSQQRAQNITNTAQYVNSVGGITPPAPGH